MYTETPARALHRQRARSVTMLVVAGLLLALAFGLFLAQDAQGNARTAMQAAGSPDSQQQVFGTGPPAPTPDVSNLKAFMPLIYNEPLVVLPPDIGP